MDWAMVNGVQELQADADETQINAARNLPNLPKSSILKGWDLCGLLRTGSGSQRFQIQRLRGF